MTTTRTFTPQILMKGILGGALVGFLIGAYVVVLSREHLIQREDFTHPIAFEQAEERYASTMLLAFVVVFAAIGPFVVAASFGPWIRHAVYGAIVGIVVVVAVTLVVAHRRNEQPFNHYKGASGACIDFARQVGLPIGALVGCVIGLAIRRYSRPHGCE